MERHFLIRSDLSWIANRQPFILIPTYFSFIEFGSMDNLKKIIAQNDFVKINIGTIKSLYETRGENEPL